MNRYVGKTVLITGGSRGIGRQTCIDFAKEGANVAFCYRSNHEAAEELLSILRSKGCSCIGIKCDVRDYESVLLMIKEVISKFKCLNILVNNAGVLRVGPLAGMRYDDWKDMMETNLNGVFNCSKAALPYIMKMEGCITNISSFMAFRPIGSGQAIYTATKAGIIGFSRVLAQEVSTSNVRVNVIAPGMIDTDMIRNVGDKNLNDILQNTMMKRLGTTQEVSSVILYICSEEASFITGQTIVVDGGGVKFQF